MRNLEIKNIKSHPSQSLAKANASRDLQINFNQAENALTIPAESRHDYKCGFATQRGRSMIEMLGVLAIIGVLSVGGIAGYSKAMMKYRINKTIEQITLIAGNVRTFFAPQRNYEDVFDPDHDDHWKIIRKAKLVPEEMWEYETDGTTFKQFTHVFGDTMGLYRDSKTSNADDKAFQIDLFNIPSEACIELVSQDWSSANIGAVEVDWVKDAKALKSPAEVDEAVEVCEHTDKNQIIFHVDIDVNSDYWKNYIDR